MMRRLEPAAPVVQLGADGERYGLGGTQVVFKCPPAGTADGWMAAEFTLAARQVGAPPHYHRQLTESFYVISGALWMRVGDREFVAGPGSYVLVTPGTIHAFANRSEFPARFLQHASDATHKEFLCELWSMIQSEKAWPPEDPTRIVELGSRYDTRYV
jgi:quercetin dioxygenase-like cupin family protein